MNFYFHGIYSIVVEIFCIILLFESFAKKRNEKMSFSIFLIITMFITGVINTYLLQDYFAIRITVVLFTMTTIMFLMFKISYHKALALTMTLLIMGAVSEYITLSALIYIYPVVTGKVFDAMAVTSLNIIQITSHYILFFLVLLIKKMTGKKSPDILTPKEWLITFTIFAIIILNIIVLISKFDILQNPNQNGLALEIIIGMLIILFSVYYLINSLMQKEIELRESIIFREKAKSETLMYHSISENLEKQRRKTHEYKNQIAAINSLLSQKQYHKLQEYINNIDKTLKVNNYAIDTNNVIVNAFLNTKYREAVNNGFVFVLKVNDLSGLKIDEESIVIILSNMLNNALEACISQKNGIIKFKFILENGQAIISVKNSINREPIVKNGEFITTKTIDSGEHGLGIKNVIETIEKYDGRHFISYDKDYFQFSVLLPNQCKTS